MAPADYEETLRKFAEALTATRFRAPLTASKLLSLVKKGERSAQKAAVLERKFTEADRIRIADESAAYKALLSNWRSVQARMPDDPALADAFAFMTEWMSVNRQAAEPAAPTPAS